MICCSIPQTQQWRFLLAALSGLENYRPDPSRGMILNDSDRRYILLLSTTHQTSSYLVHLITLERFQRNLWITVGWSAIVSIDHFVIQSIPWQTVYPFNVSGCFRLLLIKWAKQLAGPFYRVIFKLQDLYHIVLCEVSWCYWYLIHIYTPKKSMHILSFSIQAESEMTLFKIS